jgi:hypothetical protein
MIPETCLQALEPLDFARLTRASLVTTGGRFMTASQMDAVGSHFGLPGKVLYFRGARHLPADGGGIGLAADIYAVRRGRCHRVRVRMPSMGPRAPVWDEPA